MEALREYLMWAANEYHYKAAWLERGRVYIHGNRIRILHFFLFLWQQQIINSPYIKVKSSWVITRILNSSWVVIAFSMELARGPSRFALFYLSDQIYLLIQRSRAGKRYKKSWCQNRHFSAHESLIYGNNLFVCVYSRSQKELRFMHAFFSYLYPIPLKNFVFSPFQVYSTFSVHFSFWNLPTRQEKTNQHVWKTQK